MGTPVAGMGILSATRPSSVRWSAWIHCSRRRDAAGRLARRTPVLLSPAPSSGAEGVAAGRWWATMVPEDGEPNLEVLPPDDLAGMAGGVARRVGAEPRQIAVVRFKESERQGAPDAEHARVELDPSPDQAGAARFRVDAHGGEDLPDGQEGGGPSVQDGGKHLQR